MHCREILFIPRCNPKARKFPRLVNVFVRLTVAELRGVKVAQFSDFGPFSPYKTPKKYLPVNSLQPRGYIAEWFPFFHVIVEGPQECLPAAEFHTTSDRGAWDSQICPNFCLWQMAIPIQNDTTAGAADLNQICLNTFPPNIFLPTPKTPFWGPFNAKPIIERALRKSHVNGATKLKLYSCIGIDKYLGPLMQIWDLGNY